MNKFLILSVFIFSLYLYPFSVPEYRDRDIKDSERIYSDLFSKIDSLRSTPNYKPIEKKEINSIIYSYIEFVAYRDSLIQFDMDLKNKILFSIDSLKRLSASYDKAIDDYNKTISYERDKICLFEDSLESLKVLKDMKNKEIDSEKIITKNKITEDIDSEIIKPKKIDKKSRNIVINIREQKMYLYSGEEFLKKYDISSSSYGVGSEPGSNKTPLGKHVISEKFGDKAELGTIFIGRINTGRISDIYYDDKDRDTDSVLTRVLWLDGIEKGNKNSKERYIYIHGTPEEGLIGKVASHGCIRMRNSEVIELFDSVEIGTIVDIREN